MKKFPLFLSCLLILCVFACDNELLGPEITSEEEVPVIPINFEENFGTTVTARFLGRVLDEQNDPVQGATIQIGNTVTSTDIFGIFSVSDATAFEKFAYIKVEKDGYINGSRTLTPSSTEVNNVEIMLLKEDVIATITSGVTATVNLPNGTEVSFNGNFTRENGTPYNGQVDVIIKHLSPDDENMDAMMPGMLFAQNASGDAVALETYGMIAVELRSSSGEELQLAEGSISQISIPVATSSNNPPATIPLWYFDEEVGYWKEEGVATLQGNNYVGEVSHFSFWNYDFPYPSVYLCITLVDDGGRPLPYTSLDLYSALLNATGTYGFTNAAGTECGWIPAGEQLTVTIATLHCNNAPFTTTIGPFTSDANITITVPSNLSTTELTGTFVNCDGNNVTDGYIQLFINGNSQVIPVTNGSISYTVVYCNTLDFSLKGIDITSNQITNIITGTLNGSATVDVGALSSCTGFVDTDGDGVFDTFEDINGDNDLTNDDTDQDGTPNYLDIDDDGDGINTADENYDGDNDPTNDDTDGDQIPDYLDAVDVNIFDSEIIADGCNPLIFNLDAIATQYVNTNMSYAFYETEADAAAETNVLTSTYEVAFINFTDGSNIYVKGTNTITNATAVGNIYLFVVNEDSDNDGLTDCEETTGIDDPDTVSVPSGISDPNDSNDPVDFTDTDGDGLTDAEETTGNDNPNTQPTPNGISDPNDPCDPIESSSLVDSDNDGLTDCEETTSIDNPNTPSIPSGTSDPNDQNDPNQQPTDTTMTFGGPFGGNTLSESAGTIDLLVSLNSASSQNTVINIASSNVSAVAPDDYTPINTTVTILAGNISGTPWPIQIDIIDDTDFEANEAILITATVISGAVTNPIVEFYITIEDNDSNGNSPQSGIIGVCGDGNGLGVFDLNSMDTHYLNGNNGTISYHQTQADADAGMNALTSPYTSTDGITLFVRIVASTGNIQISTLYCEVYTTPMAISGLSLTECDGNGDGLAIFSLQQLDAQIIQNGGNLVVVSYHATLADAENNTNIIFHDLYLTTSRTMFFRVRHMRGGCYDTGAIDLIVDPGC
ncbi:hypothetical protein IMCC3317_17470 [Kordia antarctica]|uniref:Calx-beta domain-containing protein n=1 Tax=Kordia antarctica TaxID=1218801 RepID=A0A7L4ZIG1_9FLAO|nr:Calx-beta domain-containing protein [Kordia antarctica]QHI36385.1 hypothetical protein IMCC3317_17470 [Kordia antarctica]